MKSPKAPPFDLRHLLPAMPPDTRGISAVEIGAISQSVLDARQRRLIEDHANPIHRWATVAPLKGDEDHDVHAEIAAAVLKQIMDPRLAEQWATARKGATPMHQNRWIRDWWIICNWLKFQDPEMLENPIEIGLCDLDDEFAAEIIGKRFTIVGYSAAAFKKFRSEYKLKQVRPGLRLRGQTKQANGISLRITPREKRQERRKSR